MNDMVRRDSASYQPQQETPRLCARGCGFFGNWATQNLCSKCYRDYLKEEEEAKSAVDQRSNTTVTSTNPFPCFRGLSDTTNRSSDSVVAATATTDIFLRLRQKKNRCHCCNKKVGLTGFDCRCGGIFCGVHRYPEEHGCKFDFKIIGREAIAKQNPSIIADKLDNKL